MAVVWAVTWLNCFSDILLVIPCLAKEDCPLLLVHVLVLK
jgi:hypothetical protein